MDGDKGGLAGVLMWEKREGSGMRDSKTILIREEGQVPLVSKELIHHYFLSEFSTISLEGLNLYILKFQLV